MIDADVISGCAAQGGLHGLEPLKLHAKAGVEGELAGATGDVPLVEETGI